ncbi:MAG: amidohydrolase family protein, partial [Candidatus Bathyarchaeia archaeon]
KEDLKKHGPYLQVNPSLKSKEDREALWRGLADGTIDIVTSDHYAPLKSEKEIGWKNAWEVEGGVPGVETTLMLLLSEGLNKHRISLERLIDAFCTRPAKIYGIYPMKGVIQLGSDADIALIDIKKEFKIRADKLHYKVDWTPYEGIKIKGLPILTMVKGEILMKDGEVWRKPELGKFIKCHQ